MGFWEQVTLLLIGAGVTGITVPFVKAKMDDRKLKEQRLFEADLAREAKVIEARTGALVELAKLLWAYHYMADQVAYAGAHEEEYEAARLTFHTKGWDVLARMRSTIGGMRWFTPAATHGRLVKEYRKWVDEINERTGGLMDKEGATPDDWSVVHEWFVGTSADNLDHLMGQFSDAFGLPGDAR